MLVMPVVFNCTIYTTVVLHHSDAVGVDYQLPLNFSNTTTYFSNTLRFLIVLTRKK